VLWHLAIFSVSLLVLVKGADYLVEYSARLARRLRVSDLVVGLVVTSVGTSLPELASSVSAAAAGSSGLVVGNVVGSNIANIGLVLGIAAMIRPIATERRMHDRDGFILFASAILFFVLASDNRIGRIDAAVCLALYIAYVIFAARSEREEYAYQFRDFLKFLFEFEYATRPALRLMGRSSPPAVEPSGEELQERWPMASEAAVFAASLVALIVSARFVVSEAIWLANLVQLPENLIGLSLVAVGTSLPELLVSISGARKGKVELVVGNVMGSNIANTLLIIGMGASIRPLDVAELSVVYTIPIMLFFSLALLYMVRTNWTVGRGKGFVALAAYAGFLVTAFIQGWG
jgi:cation:H+ antiporter